MKFRTVVERIGENVGPIDWNYDFIQHFQSYCCSDEKKREHCDRAVALLRQVADNPEQWQARFGDWWLDIYEVGMYDGWPFWKPTPALFVNEHVFGGGKWEFFYNLGSVRPKEQAK